MTSENVDGFRAFASRYLVTVALLLLMFAQIVGSATRTSLTIDEGLHITSGYSMLRTGDYRLVEEHPPLVKFIAAWPLLLVPDLPDPREVSAWELQVPVTDSTRLVRVTQDLIYDYRPLDRLVFAARFPIALLALLLGAVALRWASDGFGARAGIVTLFLLAVDPNILAHAGVAATDLGTACFILIALFTFQRFLRRPTWKGWALAGLTLGLALGTKLSATLLLPTQGLLLLAYGLCCPQLSRIPFRGTGSTRDVSRWQVVLKLGIAYIGMVMLAALVLWALYGFEVGPAPELDLTLPAASHVIPWLRLREHLRGGHAAFLLGQVSHQGWWYYFPVALALKTPLPILLSWLAAAIALILGLRRQWPDELALLLFPALYLALSLQSSLNIGYRHLLPIVPLLAILAGRLATGFPSRSRNPKSRGVSILALWVSVALGTWLAIGTLALYPHYLAYFNVLAGGPDGGFRYLVDSNTDWGQALKELSRYQEQHDIGSVRLSMFTFLDPSIYGVQYEPLTPMHGDTPAVFPSRFNPPPGTYVISTTTLQGIPLADPEMYDWFRRQEPDARIGHVMFLYEVPEPITPFDWVAQCIVPVIPLSPEAIAEGFGHSGLRRAYFDCTQSWLIPEGGGSAGWYVLFGDTYRRDDLFIQTYLQPQRLSFEQTRSSALPSFAVFEAGSLSVAPAQPPPAPVQVGSLTFLGHAIANEPAARTGEEIEVWTSWQVDGVPDRPLSLMLHLIGPVGAPVVVGDSLGVPAENWQVGDVIVQRHRLQLLPQSPAGGYTVYTGAYWLDTLERWPVVQGGAAAGDQLLLTNLTVE